MLKKTIAQLCNLKGVDGIGERWSAADRTKTDTFPMFDSDMKYTGTSRTVVFDLNGDGIDYGSLGNSISVKVRLYNCTIDNGTVRICRMGDIWHYDLADLYNLGLIK
jgi:hypothetical protein